MTESDKLAAEEDRKGKKRTCGDYLTRLDQLVLRPLLIYKYEKDKEARARDFYDMFQNEGNHVRKLYEKKKTLRIEAMSDHNSQRSKRST